MSFIFPLLYCLLQGYSWAIFFRKSFYESLAPSLMTHMLIVLISGLTFQKLSFGLYLGIFLSVSFLIISIWKDIKSNNKFVLFHEFQIPDGLLVFLFLFTFCYISNIGKRFYSWDEFQHWGIFLKETLRSDRLFCSSDVLMVHKDYVPATTLFEYIWCKISGGYSEPNAYFAIQIFMFSLILPIFTVIEENKNAKTSRYGIINVLFFILIVPFIFNQIDAFRFYHSIYVDYAIGIMLFYILMQVLKKNNPKYQMLILTLGLTVLSLLKMNSIMMFPFIIILYFGLAIINDGMIKMKQIIPILFPIMVGLGIWYSYHLFVDFNCHDVTTVQTYNGVKLSSVISIIDGTAFSEKPYLKEVERKFVEAIFSRDILLHGSYAVSLAAIVIGCFVIGSLNKSQKMQIKFISIWILFTGIMYAWIMLILYGVAFPESEALRLNSFERYMNSYIVFAVMTLLFFYFQNNVWLIYHKEHKILISMICFILFFYNITAFKQVVPGFLTYDYEMVEYYDNNSSEILQNTAEDSNIFLIAQGDNGGKLVRYRYFCFPRNITEALDFSDLNIIKGVSNDLSSNEYVQEVCKNDYIYVDTINDKFIEKYNESFVDIKILKNYSLYKINCIEKDKIDLSIPVYSNSE